MRDYHYTTTFGDTLDTTTTDVPDTMSGYKRVIFYYDGGEKTILTLLASDLEIRDIAETIASSDKEFVYLEVGSAKKDLILVNRKKFIFLMASSITEQEAEYALKTSRSQMLSESIAGFKR